MEYAFAILLAIFIAYSFVTILKGANMPATIPEGDYIDNMNGQRVDVIGTAFDANTKRIGVILRRDATNQMEIHHAHDFEEMTKVPDGNGGWRDAIRFVPCTEEMQHLS